MGTLFRNFERFSAVMLASLAVIPAASAGLVGDTIALNLLYPDEATAYMSLGEQIVSPPPVTNIFAMPPDTAFPAIFIYVTDTSFQIQDNYAPWVWAPAAFNGFQLIDLTQADITGVSIDPATNLPGFGPSNVSFDSGDIFANMQGFVIDPSTVVKLDITAGQQMPMEEPATLSLLCAGVAGAMVLRWRRTSARALRTKAATLNANVA